jgi:hypothetical protein
MSESEDSSLLDFSDGSSDMYEPGEHTISDSESDENVVVNVKKRKVRNEKKWKRNSMKRRRAEGKAHVNTRGNAVHPRVTGKNCNCKYRCFHYITQDIRKTILKKFNAIADKHKQDIYLAGQITSKEVARQRPKTGTGPVRKCSNVYNIKLGSFDRKVCKLAFGSIHGVSQKRVENVAAQLNKNDVITVGNDRRGKHNNRPNRVSDSVVELVDSHIRSFPRRVSHYSRRDSKRYYLSPDLNIQLMHRLYLQQHEPDMYSKLMSGDMDGYKPKVSRDFYFRYLKANFNFTFGSPRSDTCVTCDTLENKIKNKNLSPEEVENLKIQKQLHLLKADVFYKTLREKSVEATENPHVEVLSFDYQQNFPLPKVPSGDAFYCRQLWLYNFCIHSAKNKEARCYLLDETTGCKKPNETVSFLDHYINNVLDKGVKELIIFSDNCCAQNKNYTLVQYLFLLVKSGRLQNVTHYFPVPGHSFLPCDRCFGVIEKKLKLIERVFVPNEYHTHIRNASKKFHTVNVTQDMIFDFASSFSMLFKKKVLDEKKEKFLVTKYKVFEYDINHSDEVWVSKTMSLRDSPVTKFKISNFSGYIPLYCPVNIKYEGSLPLKQAKYNDVKSLVEKYVPNSDMWFYNKIFNKPATVSEDVDEMTDDQEEDID